MTPGREPRIRWLDDADALLATARVGTAEDAGARAASEHRPDDIHPAEWLEAEILTDPRRRLQWLAGRRAAKHTLARFLGVTAFDPAAYAIRSRDRFGRPARPTVWSGGKQVAVHLSISHGESLAAAIVGRSRRVGVDVVDEGQVLLPDPWIWSAREAAYKAGSEEHAFVPEDWRVDRARPSVSGTATHRRSGTHPVRVRWLGDISGARVVAVCWSEDERSAA
jgi:4'-phosphopantetheinyl transferase EntD